MIESGEERVEADIICDIDLTKSCLESSAALRNLSASESCTLDREVLGKVSWCNPMEINCEIPCN